MERQFCYGFQGGIIDTYIFHLEPLMHLQRDPLVELVEILTKEPSLNKYF